jgi:HlyD family secretion protein
MNRPNRKPLLLIGLAGLVLAGAAYYLVLPGSPRAAQGAAQTGAAPNAKPALTVTAAQPQAASLPIRLSANGNVAAWQEAVIGSESTGLRLTQVRVNVGDVVKAGQELATFSLESTQADTAQARAGLLEAEAGAADAAANADRARLLQTSGALSAQQINQYLTLEKTARARVEAAKAVLGAQQLRGRQTRVLAPDSGVISSRSATVGAVVGSGTELFRLIRQGRLEWRAEVTASELGRIRPGTPVTLRPASGGELQGKVRMIAPSVDLQTRNALVYVDLPSMLAQRTGAASGEPSPLPSPAGRGSERGQVLPGMFARGDFELGASDALTIPQRALVVRDGFNYVFKLSPDNRVSQVKVQTGRLAGERVEILGGLAASDRVAIDGAAFLNDGDLVRIGSDSEPNQAAAPVARAQTATK